MCDWICACQEGRMDAEYCGVRNRIGQHVDSINDFDVPLYKLIKNVEIIKWS